MLFKIYGKVIEKETGKGISGLIVEALDKDLRFDERLGSVITDKNGEFEIKYDREDFGELKPDIYLQVKNSDGDIIHTTEDKVKYDAGKTEAFIVKISKKKIKNLNKKQKEANKMTEIMKNMEEVKKAKAQVVEGSLTIWNARLEALTASGDIKSAISHMNSPVEWGDNCGCNSPCGLMDMAGLVGDPRVRRAKQ